MEENTSSIESLIDRATEYGKTSFELAKLKVLDKTSDVVSTLLSHSLALIIILSFVLFLSLGLALWIGEILGKIYLGFFIVAAFYGLAWILIHFFFHNWIKKCVGDSIIKQMLKQTSWKQ
jgi:hypothetical protein